MIRRLLFNPDAGRLVVFVGFSLAATCCGWLAGKAAPAQVPAP